MHISSRRSWGDFHLMKQTTCFLCSSSPLVWFSSPVKLSQTCQKSWIQVFRNVLLKKTTSTFITTNTEFVSLIWNFLSNFYWLVNHIRASRYWQEFQSVISQDSSSSFECVHSLEMEVVQIWAASALIFCQEIYCARLGNKCFTVYVCFMLW